ncbi:hypothetical protein [Rosistilla ulvae]|uniref:hypothetical protein n=1 Tax=Rosistilla ulvae TaxID=1930277 RepID=UPI0011A9CE5B|nr:hypothetical protein [Rosistilla ulvae]
MLCSFAPPVATAAEPFPPNRTLLSNQTQAVFEILDVPQLETRWGNSFAGALSEAPELKPFFDSQRETLRQRLSESGLAFNLTLNDIHAIASGEATLGWMQLRNTNAVCIMIDTRGRDAATAEVLQRIDAELKQHRGATMSELPYQGHTISTYVLKKKLGQIKVEQFSYVRIAGRLIAADQIDAVKGIVDRIAGTGELVKASDFAAVEAKIGEGDDQDIRWFVRPLGFARVLEARSGGLKKQQLDTIQLLQEQGFDAILSAGGHLRLDDGKFDVRHQTYIHAPPTTALPSKYKLAGRMLQFPNVDEQEPPAWVLPTVASYLDGNWKLEEAFWAAETLVNQAVGDEIFRRVVDGIKKDKDGPQIDLANDIVANFRDRLILLTDNVHPVSKHSERMLIGVRLQNEAVVKAAVDKAMKSDPNAKEFPYAHHNWIWQVTQPEASDDEIELEGFEDFEEFIDESEGKQTPPLLNQWAITVYDGYLMFSSHAQMLVDSIEHHRQAKDESLSAATDFIRIRAALLDQYGPDRAIWRVLRSESAFRAKYELLRRGELKESDSVLAAIVRRLFVQSNAETDEEELQVDASELPDFSILTKHLQPSGVTLKTEPAGWFVRGLMLKPDETPAPSVAAQR